MENNKFRCHISILLEQTKGFLFALLVFIFNAAQEIVGVEEIVEEEPVPWGMIILGVLSVFAVYMLYHFLIWSKTWFYVKEGSFVYERNTVNKKVNTIAIQSISNINIEQSILERILRTCKVKLDTNSLSTANQNDVAIVLKLEDAKKLKRYLLSILNETQDTEFTENVQEEVKEYEVKTSHMDIIRHGFFVLSPIALVTFAITLTFVVHEVKETIGGTDFAGSIVSIFTNMIAVIVILFSAVKNMVKGFFAYYGLKAARIENKIHLSYGFFKKIDFEIPVDKINAVEIVQPFFCRIFGRYCVELINVGLTDGNPEMKSQLILACKKEELVERLEKLLPEISLEEAFSLKRQPKSIFLCYGWYTVVTLFVFWLGEVLVKELLPIGQTDKFWNLFMMATGILISLLGVGISVWKYYTLGSRFGDKYFAVARGIFKKTVTITDYQNVQYMELDKNIIDRRFDVCTGTFYLLADMNNQSKHIPCVKESELVGIRERICKI